MGEYDDLIAHVNGKPAGGGEYDDLIAHVNGAGPAAPSMLRQPPSLSKSDEELGLSRDVERPIQMRSDNGLGPYKTVGRTGEEIKAASDANNPIKDDWGAQGIIGGLLGGAAGRLAGPLVSRLGAAAPIATAAVEGGVSSKAQGGSGLAGALTGGAIGSLGPLGRAAMKSRGGQARQFIEEHGGTVGVTSPGKGGPYEHMDVSGTTDADIGAQAAASAEKGLGMLNQEKRGVLKGLGNEIGGIDNSLAGRAQRDVSDIPPRVEAALAEMDISPQTEDSLRRALAKLTAKQKPGFNADVDPHMISEADLNKFRRVLDRGARTGTSNAADLSPLKQAANDTRAMVDEGPYADVNARYAKESQNYRDSRRMLGISERPTTPDEKKSAVDKVTNLITRRGQNTVTAGKQEADLAGFEAKHPDIGEEFVKPAMLRKKADISFHLLPQKHGGLIDRTGSAIGTGALLEGLASLVGNPHMSPGKIALAAGTGLALQNAPAIQARLLYPGAKALAGNEEALRRLIPLFTAARAAEGERK